MAISQPTSSSGSPMVDISQSTIAATRRCIAAEHDVAGVEVAVHQAGCPRRRDALAQPVGDLRDVRQLDVRVSGQRLVRRQLAEPAVDLTVEEAVGTAEVGEPDLPVVHAAQADECVDQREPELAAQLRRAGCLVGQLQSRIEAFDRLHEIEDCVAEDAGVVAGWRSAPRAGRLSRGGRAAPRTRGRSPCCCRVAGARGPAAGRTRGRRA